MQRDFSPGNFCTLCRILQRKAPFARFETVKNPCRNRALTLRQMINRPIPHRLDGIGFSGRTSKFKEYSQNHYSDSQHCGNDQRKQNEASDLSVGCLLSLWQCVFSRRLQKSPIVCQRVTGFWERIRNEIMGMYRHESALLPPEECFFQIDLNSV